MSAGIGAAGRGALALARERAARGVSLLRPSRAAAEWGYAARWRVSAPGARVTGDADLPLAQLAPAGGPVAAAEEGAAPPAAGPEAIEGEMLAPSAEEVAERVYRLFCRDLRLEHERRGL